jgi:hypothetical protein
MKTKTTEMFGLDTPIFAFSHCRDMAVDDKGGRNRCPWDHPPESKAGSSCDPTKDAGRLDTLVLEI